LYSRISGTVQTLQADIGDHVKKGQVLAELSVAELEAELKQKAALVSQAQAEAEQVRGGVQVAEASLAQANAGVAEAEAAVKSAAAELRFRQVQTERMKALVQQKAVDDRILDELLDRVNAAEATLKQAGAKLELAKAAVQVAEAQRAQAGAGFKAAQARIEVARAELQQVEALLQYASLRAPFDGVVTRRDVNVGDLVGPPSTGRADLLFVVTRADSVRVVVAVPDREAQLVAPCVPAAVRFAVLKGQKFAGKVTRTSGTLDPKTHTLRAEIDLANPDGKLLPGMFATVTLTLEGHPDGSGPVEKPRDLPAPKPAAAEAADVKALAKARLDAAEKVYGALMKQWQAGLGRADIDQFYRWSLHWLDAQRDTNGGKEERLGALEGHFQRMMEVQRFVAELVKTGQSPAWQGPAADFYRTEAELWLAQEKQK
jgi:multidrug efflux pump subunit AcrA (membrane-fusion protein)